MDKPVLIIMAAGMGSRYGGLKQMDSIDEYGHLLMDYSVFDAKRAGFERVIIVIKPENEALFEERIGNRLRKYITIDYAHQVLEIFRRVSAYRKGEPNPGELHTLFFPQKIWFTGLSALLMQTIIMANIPSAVYTNFSLKIPPQIITR